MYHFLFRFCVIYMMLSKTNLSAVDDAPLPFCVIPVGGSKKEKTK